MFTSPHSLHPEAELYKKKFKKMKEELATKLFRLFNEEVFDNKVTCSFLLKVLLRILVYLQSSGVFLCTKNRAFAPASS